MNENITITEVKRNAKLLVKKLNQIIIETPTSPTRNALTDAVIIIDELVARLPK